MVDGVVEVGVVVVGGVVVGSSGVVVVVTLTGGSGGHVVPKRVWVGFVNVRRTGGGTVIVVGWRIVDVTEN